MADIIAVSEIPESSALIPYVDEDLDYDSSSDDESKEIAIVPALQTSNEVIY